MFIGILVLKVVGYPVRNIRENKLYPSFRISQITLNLRYENFDRNVAYSYKTLAMKCVKYLLCFLCDQ